MIYKEKKKTAAKLILISKFMVEFLIASYPTHREDQKSQLNYSAL